MMYSPQMMQPQPQSMPVDAPAEQPEQPQARPVQQIQSELDVIYPPQAKMPYLKSIQPQPAPQNIVEPYVEELPKPQAVKENYVETPRQQYTDETDNEITEQDLDFVEEAEGADPFNAGSREADWRQSAQSFVQNAINRNAENETALMPQNEEELEEIHDLYENANEYANEQYRGGVVEIQEEIPQEEIPIFPSDYEQQEEITLEKGDRVSHENFGEGTVEKIVNYGAKKMYSINFENAGRKLLDPVLSGLRRIE